MEQERRRFYRIEDSVYLKATVVKSSELDKKLEDFKRNRIPLLPQSNLYQEMDTQLDDLRSIQSKMPELARYLSILQKQVDRLTAAVLPEEPNPDHQRKQVNLSAQGISFTTDDSFKPVDIVELYLQLQPSAHQLLIFSRVVLVEDNEDELLDGRYRVSLDFENIHEADRETLIKHVHGKQLHALGSRSHTKI